MNNPLISIIIPVYNVEKYLRRCLDSILTQSYTNWEAILVDDGSKDCSGNICDEYTNRDARFRVLHIENRGVSHARNIGIKESTSEWMYFSDADDELLPNALEDMISSVSDGIDLVSASYIRNDNGTVVPERVPSTDSIYTKEEFIAELFKYKSRNCERYCWNKLFRKAIIVDNTLSFDESMVYREDVLFLFNYLVCCRGKVNCIKQPVYVYCRRTDGAAMTYVTHYSNKSKDIVLSIAKSCDVLKKLQLSSYTEFLVKRELINSYHQVCKMIRNSGQAHAKDDEKELRKIVYNRLTWYDIVKMRFKDLVRPFYKAVFKKPCVAL